MLARARLPTPPSRVKVWMGLNPLNYFTTAPFECGYWTACMRASNSGVTPLQKNVNFNSFGISTRKSEIRADPYCKLWKGSASHAPTGATQPETRMTTTTSAFAMALGTPKINHGFAFAGLAAASGGATWIARTTGTPESSSSSSSSFDGSGVGLAFCDDAHPDRGAAVVRLWPIPRVYAAHYKGIALRPERWFPARKFVWLVTKNSLLQLTHWLNAFTDNINAVADSEEDEEVEVPAVSPALPSAGFATARDVAIHFVKCTFERLSIACLDVRTAHKLLKDMYGSARRKVLRPSIRAAGATVQFRKTAATYFRAAFLSALAEFAVKEAVIVYGTYRILARARQQAASSAPRGPLGFGREGDDGVRFYVRETLWNAGGVAVRLACASAGFGLGAIALRGMGEAEGGQRRGQLYVGWFVGDLAGTALVAAIHDAVNAAATP